MGEYEREIELYDYIEILLKYKFFIIVTTLVCGAASWLISPEPPPARYRADAVLMVKSHRSTGGVQGNAPASNNTSGFYEKLALADDLKQALIDSLDLQSINLRGLDDMLQVAVLDPGVQLSVRSEDPELARHMVNKWAQVFVDRNSDVNIDEVGSYYDFVTDYYETSLARLESVEARLDSSEAVNRVSFLQVKKTILDSAATRIFNELFDVESRLAQIKLDFQVAEDRLETIEANSRYGTRSGGRQGTELSSLVKLRKAQADLSKELEEALRAFDDEHELEEFRRRAITAERDTLEARINVLKRELAMQNPLLGEVPNPTYVQLSQRLTESRIALELLPPNESTESDHDVNTEPQPPLASLRERYTRLLEQRTTIIADFTAQKEQLESQRKMIEDRHNLSLDKYISQFALRDSLAAELEILETVKNNRGKRLDSIRDSLEAVKDSLAFRTREQNRLTRSQQRLSETVTSFSNRIEEARIAREKAAGDIRVLTRALDAKQLPTDPIQTKTAIAAGVGFLISTILSLLIEYMRKARAFRGSGGGT